jgi:hypothetical protein
MPDRRQATRPDLVLASVAGGYLRNPVREDRATCATCLTPVGGYDRCFVCHSHSTVPGLADRTAFLTYAVAGQKSGYLMRGYKATPPVAEHAQVIGLMLLIALQIHTRCAGVLADRPVTHWAVVPSLPSKPYPHPLHRLVAAQAQGSEARLTAAPVVRQPRTVRADHFSCAGQLQHGSHVLLVDDTWASGGHAQSAALALRAAGAAQVSLLVVARWLKEDYGGNRAFITSLAKRDYDPLACPWTGGSCP